jgi:hypothetical protein
MFLKKKKGTSALRCLFGLIPNWNAEGRQFIAISP